MDAPKTKWVTSQHTPGPWNIVLKSDPMSEDGAIVGSYNDHEIRPDVGVKLGSEAADLRLIAAAPDMLKALRTIANQTDLTSEQIKQYASAAIAAIAKVVQDV